MKIRPGISERHRAAAAELYWHAFGEKLYFVLGPKAQGRRFIEDVLRRDHAISALDDTGELIGVAGFRTRDGALVSPGFDELRRAFGLTSALLRSFLMGAVFRERDDRPFFIDGIFVARSAQGQGVGTALLRALVAEARARGYRQIRLRVIDSNTRARAIYRAEGFVEVAEDDIGLLRHFFGFRRAITMVRDV